MDNIPTNNEQEELDTFVDQFIAGLEPEDVDKTADPAPDAPAPDAPAPEPTDDTETPEAKDEENTEDQQKDSKPDNVPKSGEDKEKIEEVFNKSDKAFAELRVTNKSQGDLLLRMTRLANIKASTPAEALQELAKHLDKLEAEHGNLTYQEVEKIRQMDKEQAIEKAQLHDNAYSGFKELKELHNLDDEGIYAFAEELKNKGLNPFETPVDLVAQYRGMHYEQLMANAKEAGRQEEIARRLKATQQATVPSNKVSSGADTPGDRIDSTDMLRRILEK